MKELNKCAEVSQRQSEVTEQMGYLDSNISRLDDITNMLRERLSKVLNSKPCGTSEIGKEEQSVCQHASDLRSFNQRLNNIHNSLNELLQDIEL